MIKYDYVKFQMNRPSPYSIAWDVTNKCNLNCKHCFNYSGDVKKYNFENELSYDEFISVAKQIAAIKPDQCCLCGGETLLNPYIYEAIKILTEAGIITNMVSNGYFLTKEVAQKLKLVNINSVQISVDGLGFQHDIFRNKQGAFDHAIEALINLHDANVDTMVSFCPNRLNYQNFDMFADYIKRIAFCKTIRMMPLLPSGRGKSNFEELSLSSKEQFEFVNTIKRFAFQHQDYSIEWGDPLEHLYLILLNRRRYPVVMCISANGDLKVTPYIPIKVGNLRKKSIEYYWKNGYSKIFDDKRIIEIIKKVRTILDLQDISETEFLYDIP